MSKVNFEFDENEEREDVELIIHRHKLISALYELQSYRRSIYKGYISSEELIVVDDKVVARGAEKLEANYDVEKAKAYLSTDDILRELDYILDKVWFLLD
ncbi:MAG: hypothetical protein ACI4U9_03330 [Clostridia bacterium]